ncbi:MAG: nucleotide exchange factor GrpE [Gammaproteobacteria bacterium]|nr:nucleotide exchange factor GrpE [Gammaproteobacteria bacterium]
MSPNTSDNHIDQASEAGSKHLRDEFEPSASPNVARADAPGPETSRDDGSAESGLRDEADGKASQADAEPAADSRGEDEPAANSPDGDEPLADAPDGSGRSRGHLEREIDHLNDRHLRLAAEFENYRKRVRAEKRETWARAQADLVRRLVDSVDDLQRVALLDPKTASVQDIVEGVDLVERKLLRALADAGLEVLDPAGEDFDPNVMEAVMMAPASSEEEDDTVDMVLQRGYLLEGHLVRPARVSVRKHD